LLVTRAENEASRPNRMETRFLGIAYLGNLRKELAFLRDLTNELSTYPNRSGRIASPSILPSGSAGSPDGDDAASSVRSFAGRLAEAEFHKPDLLIPSRSPTFAYRRWPRSANRSAAWDSNAAYRFTRDSRGRFSREPLTGTSLPLNSFTGRCRGTRTIRVLRRASRALVKTRYESSLRNAMPLARDLSPELI